MQRLVNDFVHLFRLLEGYIRLKPWTIRAKLQALGRQKVSMSGLHCSISCLP